MARSKFKLIYVHRSQFKRFLFNKIKRAKVNSLFKFLENKKITIRPFYLLWKRAATITNHFINKKIAIYNGKLFHIRDVKLSIKGYKLGELSTSRKKAEHFKKKKSTKKASKEVNEIKKYKNLKLKKKKNI